jgi:hypothetical protein
MKITYHIPTEQYGFVEAEVVLKEGEEPDSYKDIKDLFRDAGEEV